MLHIYSVTKEPKFGMANEIIIDMGSGYGVHLFTFFGN
jgi:hypothetical protein